MAPVRTKGMCEEIGSKLGACPSACIAAGVSPITKKN